jgi:hypothetical protein
VSQYDKEKVAEAIKQVFMGFLILGGINYYYGGSLVMPLLIQGIMVYLNLGDNNLFQIYVMGAEATGALKRPWTPPSPFGLPAPPAAEEEEPAAEVEKKDKKKD